MLKTYIVFQILCLVFTVPWVDLLYVFLAFLYSLILFYLKIKHGAFKDLNSVFYLAITGCY